MKHFYPKYKKLKLFEFDLKSVDYVLNKPYTKFKLHFSKIYKARFFEISNVIKDNSIFYSKHNTIVYEHHLYPIHLYPKVKDLDDLSAEQSTFLKIEYHKKFKNKFFKYKITKKMLDKMNSTDIANSHVFTRLEKVEQKFQPNSLKSLYFKNLQNLRRLRVFYGLISYSEIKRLVASNIKKRQGAYNYFFMQLESRLDVILLRLNLFDTIFEAKTFIKKGLLTVKRHYCSNIVLQPKNPSFRLHPTDLFCFDTTLRLFFYKLLLNRYKNGKLIYNLPSYLEVNFRLFMGIFNFKLYNVKNIPYYFEANPKIFYLLYINRLR